MLNMVSVCDTLITYFYNYKYQHCNNVKKSTYLRLTFFLDFSFPKFPPSKLVVLSSSPLNFKMHSMVFIVIVMGSDASFVHGTCISNSWICPDTKLKGSCNSCSNTSNRKSKLWKEASPPHSDTYTFVDKQNKISLSCFLYLWIFWSKIFNVLIYVAE